MSNNQKVVYLLLAADMTLKVGVTKDMKRRFSAISSTSGKQIVKVYHTGFISNAGEIESLMKKHFADRRILGEWFNVDFTEAKKVLTGFFEQYQRIELENDSDYDSSDLIDFALGKTRILNRLFLSKYVSIDDVITIEKPLIQLNNDEVSPPFVSVFKAFWELAYQGNGVKNVEDLQSLSKNILEKIYSAECIISLMVKRGIAQGNVYKDIYQSCKNRMITYQELFNF